MIVATRRGGEADWRYPEVTLDRYLRRAAEIGPTRLAIVEGDVRISYSELDGAVESFSAGLQALGITAGSVVTTQLPNWWESVVAIQSVLRNGCITNPVVTIYRDTEVAFIVRQATPRAVIICHRYRGFDHVEMMQRILGSDPDPPLVVVVRPDGALPNGFVSFEEVAAPPPVASPPSSPKDIAVLLYTSGTTADPKGVLHSHQTMATEIDSIIRLCRLGPEDAVFMPSPVGHVTGVLFGILLPAHLAIPSVLMDKWDPATAASLIESNRCTFSTGATPFLVGLRDAYRSRGETSSLKFYGAGGSDVPPSLVAEARMVLGANVVRGYGSSEVPTVTMCGPDDDPRLAIETDGTPIGGNEFRIDGRAGEAGEIVVTAPEMFLGYLDPSLNAAAFTDDGWFRTGDLGRCDGRGLVVTGRQKDIILRGGENISVKEVEDLLYDHPLIAEVAIVAMPDPVLGERGCAFVVPVGDARLTLPDLVAWLDGYRIAKQKYPERLVLVSDLPKTPSGKIQKFRLRDLVNGTSEGSGAIGGETGWTAG